MAELYTTLIEAYENQHYPVPHAEPHKFLEALLEQRGLVQADIAVLVDGRGRASEILNGKRSIRKGRLKSWRISSMFRPSCLSSVCVVHTQPPYALDIGPPSLSSVNLPGFDCVSGAADGCTCQAITRLGNRGPDSL